MKQWTAVMISGIFFTTISVAGISSLEANKDTPQPSKKAVEQKVPTPDELLAQKALEKKKRAEAREELKTEEEITREWQAERHYEDFEPVEGFHQDVSDSRRE